VTVADIHWNRFLSVVESTGRRPFFDLLFQDETSVAETIVPDRPSASLAHLTPEERLRHCTTEVRSLAGAILGLDIGAVDLDQGFFDMGFDSLMGLELKLRLEAAMGISLPATLVLNYPTVRDLAEFIATVNLYCEGGSQ